MGIDVSGWRTRLTDDMIERFTGNGRWANRTLAHCAVATAERKPDAIAVIDGSGSTSYRSLLDEANRLAAAFRSMGLVAGDVVSFQLPNWREVLAINVAATMTGLIVNPIVPIYRDAEVGFILGDARAKLVFIPSTFRGFDYVAMVERLRPRLPQLRETVVVRAEAPGCVSYDAFAARGGSGFAPAFAPDPNAIKLVLYTSGTTGVPKGVLHSHNTIMAEIDAVVDFWRLHESDVVLMPSPVTHITGYLYALELPVARGIQTILMERWNPVEALYLVRRYGVTFSVGATPFLKELVAEAERAGGGLESMRRYMTGGAPVPPEQVVRANRVLPNGFAFRVYGSSEAPTITLGILDREQEALGANTDGRIVGHEVRIVDSETGARLPDGADGEIVTRGPELMLGYTDWSQTEACFDAEGFFHTGDLGYISHDDFITVTGRKKDLIVRGGEKISPKEIEDVLHAHPAIREVAVVAAPHERLGETVCAFLIPADGSTVTLQTLVDHLERARIARQKFPERIVIVDDLPRTASGKVQKNVLRDRLSVPLKTTGAAGLHAMNVGAVSDANPRPTAEQELNALRRMLLIRRMEERLGERVKAGAIPGAVHLYIGQEAVAVGVCSHLGDGDWIASTHRGHGHFLAKGGSARGMVAEIYGRAAGVCGGKGGSMHVADFAKGILGANGIVGGGIGLAAGAALATQHAGGGKVAVVFFGDGGATQGVVSETMNLAALWRLPLVLVCENNGYSEFSRSSTVNAGPIAARASAYGIFGVDIDGNDFHAVWAHARAAILRARTGGGPTLIEARTYRLRGHVETERSFLGSAYRSDDEIAEWSQRDPIPSLEAKILARDESARAAIEAIRHDVEAAVDDAYAGVEELPLPVAADAIRDMLI